MDGTLHTFDLQPVFRDFAEQHIAPHAGEQDRLQRFAPSVVPALATDGYLAPFLPPECGGAGMSWVDYGVLHDEVGRACSSVRSLLTVHGMVAYTVFRWGSAEQRRRWLPAMVRGEVLGALGISEPDAGSDINGVRTTARAVTGGFIVNGAKKWITIGQVAGLYLLLVKCDGKPTTLLVPRDLPGLTVTALDGITGTRGSMLAILQFDDCFVAAEHLVGRPGFGNPIAMSALSLGRYSVASGAAGIIQASLDASLAYARRVERFGSRLMDHQLIQQMISRMVTDLTSARLLYREVGRLRDAGDSGEARLAFIAKYQASTAAMRAADHAVQIHGANGCSADYPVERYLRDAKVAEIIEGSTQIQEITIAALEFQSQSLQATPPSRIASPTASGPVNGGHKHERGCTRD